MSEKVAIQLDTLTRLADGFRESRGIANNLTTEQMIALAQEPIKPEQEKTVDITTNGATEITADEGYTLSKVMANVNVAASGGNKLAQLADKTITEVTAEDLEGAISIPQNFFKDCRALVSAIISDSVTSIGRYAFQQCYNLISVIIGNGVTSIENDAFGYCDNLTNITIGNNVTNIGNNAFYGCGSLTNITIPNGVTSISDYMFYSCENLTSITIPNSVTSIGKSAFYYCSNLASIIIGNSVTSIGNYALYIGALTNKATITFLPTTPPTISTDTFDVTKLNKIIVPAGCGDVYKSATNWANFADYIEEAAE